MRRVTQLAILMLVLAATTVFAQGPYIVSDPYPAGPDITQPDDFVIVFNGTTYYSAAVEDANGLRFLSFDLEGLWQPGVNTTMVYARNVWGESTTVPFDFAAGPPGTPGGIRVQSSPGIVATLSPNELTPRVRIRPAEE